jgi:hypothetical protein
MRKVLVTLALVLATGSAFAIGQTGVATNAGYVSANRLPVLDKPVPTTPLDSGPRGADQIKYDSGPYNWYRYFDRRTRYAVRMDPAYHPAVVAQCDFCIYEMWPQTRRDSIYVQIWLDRDGDNMPDFPAVWAVWAQETDSAPDDSVALAVPVPLGQFICDSGSFWVGMMMDTATPGADYLTARNDVVLDYPDHQVLYDPAGDTWKYWDDGGDWMIRCWTYAADQEIACVSIIVPGGQVRVGDTIMPRVRLLNLGNYTFYGWVWMWIEHTCSTDRYLDSLWLVLASLEEKDTTFRQWAARYPGLYRMECSSDTTDTTWYYFTAVESSGVEEFPPRSNLEGDRIEVRPNPVLSQALIRYQALGKSRVKLRVLDTRGRAVRTLVSGYAAAGEHTAVWDARDDQGHPAVRGIYFVRLESPGYSESKKLILTE